jgi:hypothetical protein
MAKSSKQLKQETTDFSWANLYIEDMRHPKYVRIQVAYPFKEKDRKAGGNVDYLDPRLRRSTRGRVPRADLDMNNLTVAPTPLLNSSKYLFINNANNGINVPDGYYATSSGIAPIDFIPFSKDDPTRGPPIGNPGVISDFKTQVNPPVEYFIGKNIRTLNMMNTTPYYPASPEVTSGLLEWEIKGEYSSPVYPQLRYPRGAKRKDFFKK